MRELSEGWRTDDWWEPAGSYFFADYRFEVADALLVSPRGRSHLRPKAAGVLRELLAHSGRVVSRRHLLDTVWDEPVGENVLTVCINELRGHLSGRPTDEPLVVDFIATVHRYGYQFLPAVHVDLPPPTTPAHPLPASERGLAVLDTWWAAAASGLRTSGVVVGPHGTGKSGLVRAFQHRLAHQGPAAVALARCAPRPPGREPAADLEVFVDVFGSLCRGPAAATVRDALARFAPSWLVRMPSLVREGVHDRIGPGATGASTARMFREAAEALDAVSGHVPVAILLDDVDAADDASTALLSVLSERPSSARLLLVATSTAPVRAAGAQRERIELSRTAARDLSGLDDAVVRARALLASRPPDAALRAWLRHVAQRVRTGPEALAVLASADPRRPAAVRAHRRLVAAVTDVLEAGARRGLLRSDVDPEDVTALLYGALRAAAGRSPGTASRLLDLVVDGLRATGRANADRPASRAWPAWPLRRRKPVTALPPLRRPMAVVRLRAARIRS